MNKFLVHLLMEIDIVSAPHVPITYLELRVFRSFINQQIILTYFPAWGNWIICWIQLTNYNKLGLLWQYIWPTLIPVPHILRLWASGFDCYSWKICPIDTFLISFIKRHFHIWFVVFYHVLLYIHPLIYIDFLKLYKKHSCFKLL